MMGLKPSPYVYIKVQFLAMEVVLGDRHGPGNPFRWAKVILIIPGSEHYDPKLPRLWKAQDADSRRLAATLVQHVDDLRAAGSKETSFWEAMHQISSKLTYLGIQVTARKTGPPSMIPGAWAGSVVMGAQKVWV
jgi:hypothetical protein